MARNNRMDRFGNETALCGIKAKGDFGVAYFVLFFLHIISFAYNLFVQRKNKFRQKLPIK